MITFVENWDQAGTPTHRARVAEVRAFLALCLTDRAWVRLRELEEAGEVDNTWRSLMAQMFILRGWPQRAQQPLQEALADDPEDEALLALQVQAGRPPARPEAAHADTPDFRKALTVAETFMAQNSLLRARTVLERLRRDFPDQPRVKDLLWALEGEFLGPKTDMATLATRFTPDLSSLAEDAGDSTESFDRTDHGLIPTEIDEQVSAAPGSFPSLFRSVEAEDEGFEHDEKTQSSSLAPMELGLDDEVSAPGSDLRGDTEILTVLHTEGQSSLARPDRIHKDSDLDFDGGGFDLEAFRREMGMKPPSSDLGGPALSGGLEAEDDDLIVLTRQEPRADEEVPEEELATLPLDPPTVEQASEPEEIDLDPSTTVDIPAVRVAEPPEPSGTNSVWLGVLLAVVVLGSLAMVVLLVLGLAAGSGS